MKDTSTYPSQRKVLEYFIAAADQKKFVNLHTKAGEKEILDLLEKYNVRRAIIHWYSGPLDILQAMIDFGCYFTIGVEVHYSDHIKAIAKLIPDHLLLTETDNPGALKWLKKNEEIGMPMAIKDVVNTVAELRQSTPDEIESLVQTNCLGLSPTTRGLAKLIFDYYRQTRSDRRSLGSWTRAVCRYCGAGFSARIEVQAEKSRNEGLGLETAIWYG